MYASDLPMEAVSAVGRAEDVSILMHSAGQQRLHCWPLPTVPSTHVDVSMVSAGLTLFGPGALLLAMVMCQDVQPAVLTSPAAVEVSHHRI